MSGGAKRARAAFAALAARFRKRGRRASTGYVAFISYKHAVNTAFAESLEKALKAYAKPMLARPIRVFRDEKHLVPGNDLPKLIADALDNSDFLVLIASPEAAQSPWVHDEVQRWCGVLRRSDRLIVVLVSGEIRIDDVSKRVDWNGTNALPPALSAYITTVPLYVDLRRTADQAELTLDDPKFKHAVNKLVARFRNVDPNEMVGEEILQHRRNLRVRNGAVAALIALTLISIVAAYIALREAAAARDERNNALQALAVTYAEKGRLEWLDRRPARALPYLAAAFETMPRSGPVGRLLRRALARVVPENVIAEGGDNVADLKVCPQASQVVVRHWTGRVSAWDITAKPVQRRFSVSPQQTDYAYAMLSGDGCRAAKVEGGAVTLWDVMAGRPIARLNRFPHFGLNVAGTRFLSMGNDVLEVWQIEEQGALVLKGTWQPHKPLPAWRRSRYGPHAIAHASFAPDGEHVFTGGADGLAHLWKLGAGKDRQVERVASFDVGRWVHEEGKLPSTGMPQVVSVVMSPDGQWVATATGGDDIRLWSATGRRILQVADAATLGVGSLGGLRTEIRFSPDSRVLIVQARSGAVLRWDVEQRRFVTPIQFGAAAGLPLLVFSGDGNWMLSGAGGKVLLHHVRAGEGFEPVVSLEAPAAAAVMAFEQGRLVVAGREAVRTWRFDVLLPRLLGMTHAAHAHKGPVKDIAFDSESRRIVTGGADGKVKVWNAATGALATTACYFPGTEVPHVDVRPDGRQLIAAARDGAFCGVDLDPERPAGALLEEGRPYRVGFLKYVLGGERILTAGLPPADHTRVSVWSSRSFARIHDYDDESLECGGQPSVSPTGTRVLTVGTDEVARIWDTTHVRLVTTLAGKVGERSCAAFSLDGRRIVTAPWDGVPTVWDATSGLRVADFLPDEISDAHSRATQSTWNLAWSPDGRTIATAFDSATVILWNAETGRVSTTLDGATGVQVLSFSPQGDLVLTAGDSGARLWDAHSGLLVDVLDTRESAAWAAAFSADGDFVAVAGSGLPRLWDISAERRAPKEIRDQVDCFGPWRLVNGALVGWDKRPKHCEQVTLGRAEGS